MDLPQIILLIAISLVAAVLVFLGIESILFLREAKQTLRRVDTILTDFEYLSRNLTQSTFTLGHLAESVRSGLEIAGVATKLVTSLTSKKKS